MERTRAYILVSILHRHPKIASEACTPMSNVTERRCDETPHAVVHPERLIDFQLSLLESLYGKSWFHTDVQRKQNHPAYARWQFCRTLGFLGGRLIFPEHRIIVPAIGSLLLDNFTIAACSGGDKLQFCLGTFANYGDEKVQKRIRRAIQLSSSSSQSSKALSPASSNTRSMA